MNSVSSAWVSGVVSDVPLLLPGGGHPHVGDQGDQRQRPGVRRSRRLRVSPSGRRRRCRRRPPAAPAADPRVTSDLDTSPPTALVNDEQSASWSTLARNEVTGRVTVTMRLAPLSSSVPCAAALLGAATGGGAHSGGVTTDPAGTPSISLQHALDVLRSSTTAGYSAGNRVGSISKSATGIGWLAAAGSAARAVPLTRGAPATSAAAVSSAQPTTGSQKADPQNRADHCCHRLIAWSRRLSGARTRVDSPISASCSRAIGGRRHARSPQPAYTFTYGFGAGVRPRRHRLRSGRAEGRHRGGQARQAGRPSSSAARCSAASASTPARSRPRRCARRCST